jgi:GNAT superfamily N-acetyltransferase
VANDQYEWRGSFQNVEVNALHAEAFDHPIVDVDWESQLRSHSLGWVLCREGGALVGFVNVPWDGGLHAFILDTIVSRRRLRQGVGKRLVDVAAKEARAAGCMYLHVDFEKALEPFYLGACGFQATPAGFIRLGT